MCIRDSLGVAQFLPGRTPEIAPEKQKEIQKREQYAQAFGPAAEHQAEQAQGTGKQGQPLYLYRNDEKQKQAHFRVQHGKGKEQRQIQIIGGAPACDDGCQNGAQHTEKVVDICLLYTSCNDKRDDALQNHFGCDQHRRQCCGFFELPNASCKRFYHISHSSSVQAARHCAAYLSSELAGPAGPQNHSLRFSDMRCACLLYTSCSAQSPRCGK